MSITALTLGGGGSKGDFEVGALHYVYDVLGRRPAVLSCTSVGSINGLKLAEGEGASDQGLAGLTEIWLSLQRPEDFWTVSPWLGQDSSTIRYVRQALLDVVLSNPASAEDGFAVNGPLQALRAAETAAIAQRLSDTSGVSQTVRTLTGLVAAHLTLGLLPTPTGTIGAAATAAALVSALATTAEELSDALTAESLFTLGPLRARAGSLVNRQLITAWAGLGNRLRMATVGLRSGELHFVTETGVLVDRAGTTVLQSEPAITGCASEEARVQELTDDIADVQAGIARRERTAAAPPPSLASLKAALATATAALTTCRAGQVPVRLPVTVDLVQGMFASASVPAFFPAVEIGADEYVDGGIRAIVPIDMALSLTGPDDEIIAIAASRQDPDEVRGPRQTMAQAALRSLMDIAINEIARRDTNPYAGFPGRRVHVIQPRIDVHSLVAVDPALIRQRMAYGFMCAADTLAPPARADHAEQARAAADRISVLRYGAVRLERWLRGESVPPNGIRIPPPDAGQRNQIATTLSEMKQEVRALIERRVELGAGMPSGTTGSWDEPATWWALPEAGPGAPTLRPLDAAFVRQSVPSSLIAGTTTQVVVVMQNTGALVWRASDGVALAPTGAGWGVSRIPVSGDVPFTGESAFVFDITAPTATGALEFAWRMTDSAGNPFGDGSDIATIAVVPAGEPAECATLRARIAAIQREIERIEALLVDDPRLDGPRLNAIARLRREADTALARSRAIGCT